MHSLDGFEVVASQLNVLLTRNLTERHLVRFIQSSVSFTNFPTPSRRRESGNNKLSRFLFPEYHRAVSKIQDPRASRLFVLPRTVHTVSFLRERCNPVR